MASAVASKGVPLAGLLKKLLAAPSGAPAFAYALRPASVAGTRRLFNSGGSPLSRVSNYGYDDDNIESSSSEDDADPVFFSLAERGRRTTLEDLKQSANAAEASAAARAGLGSMLAAPRRGWWVAKDDDDAVTLKVPMPGLGKEHVKVWADADQNALVVKGLADDDDDDEDELRFSNRIELPADEFKMEQVRAEMKNGLLKVTLPRVKDEERTDMFKVTVE